MIEIDLINHQRFALIGQLLQPQIPALFVDVSVKILQKLPPSKLDSDRAMQIHAYVIIRWRTRATEILFVCTIPHLVPHRKVTLVQ